MRWWRDIELTAHERERRDALISDIKFGLTGGLIMCVIIAIAVYKMAIKFQ